MSSGITITSTKLTDADAAIKEITEQLDLNSNVFVMLFFSISYNRCSLSKAINNSLSCVEVVGCSTSGEIGLNGYDEKSITAIAFSKEYFKISSLIYPSISKMELNVWHEKTQRLYRNHNDLYNVKNSGELFSLLLIDGVSCCEEPFVRTVSNAISNVPLVGGSAGDNLHFVATYLYYKGEMHVDCAALMLVSTTLPFNILKSQHIYSTSKRMIVTDAIPKDRIVTELNGFPAAEEYARMLGLSSPEELTEALIASHPTVVVIGKDEFVRSIKCVNDDGSLTFYCAIDVGIVLRLAQGNDLHDSMKASIESIENDMGEIQGLLTFDCILRRLELKETENLSKVSNLLVKHNAVGFSTYGEQINGLHVNQTCTGIAIGFSNE